MKIRLGLFFGGESVEHEVSVISGLQALQNVDGARFDATPIYISKQGEFYIGDDVGKIESYRDIAGLLGRSTKISFVRDNGHVYMLRHPAKMFGKTIVGELDVAMPVVHGTNCEDGSLQGMLTMLGLPYTGSDVWSSAVGMDKLAQKAVLRGADVPVLDAVRVTRRQFEGSGADGIADGFPVIVKPINLGSSVGISIAHDNDMLRDALDLAFHFADIVLVEPAITQLKEINCAVLGDLEDARASVCEEPLGSDEILSYADKYMRGGKGFKTGGSKSSGSDGMASLGRKIPADITEQQRETVQRLAVTAFQTLGCAGVARIDFMLDKSSGEIYFNEINTIPGSLAFYLWEASGMSYTQLLSEMVDIALKGARRKRGLTLSFDTNLLAGAKLGGAKGAKS